jgi:hypothetical protein
VLPFYPNGTYETYIHDINDFLAVVYKKHFLNNITINTDEHPYLNRIIETAKSYPYSTYRGPIKKAKPETGYEDGFILPKNKMYRNTFNTLLHEIEMNISKQNTPFDKSKKIDRIMTMLDYYDYQKHRFVSESENDTNLVQETHKDILEDLLDLGR